MAALATAGLARLAGPRVAEAGHNTNIAYDSQTVMHLDVTNTTAGSSRISSNIAGTAAFVALNNYPVGISRPDGALGRTMYTTSNCAGVAGTCEAASGGIGVMGAAKATNGCGVYGFAGSVVPSTVAPAGTGVYGSVSAASGASGHGVYGIANAGVGVRGDSTSNGGVIGTTSSNNGVIGVANGAGGGVYGQANGAGSGVTGVSTSGVGVAGISANNIGVLGDASAAGTGAFGRTVNGIGVAAQATGAGFAAVCFGNVVVNGTFTVGAGFAKSGAVRFPDGTVRRLYSTEAPESWLEDYGEGKIVDGKANVPIPADFLNAVNLKARYHVFVTPHAPEVGALAVTARESDHFEVQAGTKGANGTFSFRIVGKRKDIGGALRDREAPRGAKGR